MTYKDDGSGFVAQVTYDGVIGPPAIPLADNDGEDYNNDDDGGGGDHVLCPYVISLPDRAGDSMLLSLKETFLYQLGCLRSQSKIVTSSLPRCRGKQAMRRKLKWKIGK